MMCDMDETRPHMKSRLQAMLFPSLPSSTVLLYNITSFGMQRECRENRLNKILHLFINKTNLLNMKAKSLTLL